MSNFTKKYYLISIVFLVFAQQASAQFKDYKYTREVQTNHSLWNEILLPWEIFEHIQSNYADIRLYTISQTDTIEEPYLLEILESKQELKRLNFDLINQVKDNRYRYYTFALDSIQSINEISLDFRVQNFDTRITLLGSNDNKKWFVIKENQRILAIHNQEVKYAFTTLSFPKVRYKFLKIQVKEKRDLKLQSASITYDVTKNIGLNDIKNQTFVVENNKEKKNTIIHWSTNHLAPISSLHIDITDRVDYIRPIRVYYATDSSKTNDGMSYHYRELFHDMISSFEPSTYYFSPTVLKRLKIEIINDDNQALTVEKLQAQANTIRLKTRISNEGKHFMLYGNKFAHFPKYDIKKFQNKIPKNLYAASLGMEILNPTNFKEKIPEVKPVFENKIWLWALMGLIIGILGWYTFKMMK